LYGLSLVVLACAAPVHSGEGVLGFVLSPLDPQSAGRGKAGELAMQWRSGLLRNPATILAEGDYEARESQVYVNRYAVGSLEIENPADISLAYTYRHPANEIDKVWGDPMSFCLSYSLGDEVWKFGGGFSVAHWGTDGIPKVGEDGSYLGTISGVGEWVFNIGVAARYRYERLGSIAAGVLWQGAKQSFGDDNTYERARFGKNFGFGFVYSHILASWLHASLGGVWQGGGYDWTRGGSQEDSLDHRGIGAVIRLFPDSRSTFLSFHYHFILSADYQRARQWGDWTQFVNAGLEIPLRKETYSIICRGGVSRVMGSNGYTEDSFGLGFEKATDLWNLRIGLDVAFVGYVSSSWWSEIPREKLVVGMRLWMI